MSYNITWIGHDVHVRLTGTLKLIDLYEINGKITDDEGWDVVEWSSDFVQKSPSEGIDPTYQTKFKVIYDAKYLYIAIRAFDDNPELIQQRLRKVILHSNILKHSIWCFLQKSVQCDSVNYT